MKKPIFDMNIYFKKEYMFKCQNCSKEFKTTQALGSHEGKCKFNKKYHFIYKTTNLINQKYYIGMHSTNNIDDGYLGSGKKLYYAIKKYGKENFKREIIEYLHDRNSLALRESEIVNKDLLQDDLCMNLILGGYDGYKSNSLYFSMKIQKDSIYKENYSKICIERNKLIWQNIEYKEQRLKSDFYKGKIWKGRHHSNETKLLMSKNRKGRSGSKGINNPCYGTCWVMKDNISKRIKREELDNYLQNGWIKGMKMNKSFYWVNKNGILKQIKKEELEQYIQDGWIKGTKPNIT